MKRTLVVGMGEVGRAHYEVLKGTYSVQGYDIIGKWPCISRVRGKFDVMHVCLDYAKMGHEGFCNVVTSYATVFKPEVVNVCSTVRPGTCEELGPRFVHSTTRGLHPRLAESLRVFVKHVGGPEAERLCAYFARAGIKTRAHELARTTELAHIAYNSAYGVALMFADEVAELCRQLGVDYTAVLSYFETGNAGFRMLDQKSKVRPVLTPPGGRIGGHCLVQGAGLIPEELRGAMLERLAYYGREDDR